MTGASAIHRMPFGAEPDGEGVRFRLWAPNANTITLCLEGPEQTDEQPMPALADGWREAHVAGIGEGARYRFRVDNDLLVPDPASRHQPLDVHGPSEVIDPTAYVWRCTDWRGRPWEDAVIYELHVGAFTPEGTFRAAIDQLPYLAALGVTAIELMPVADFPGAYDWGYDGVSLFAPDATYGRPEDLKAFVDAAHGHGLMVILDVVYNHFGPEGNYLHVYGKRFFNEAKHTPWGAAINFDADGSTIVRRFFIDNALYWLEEFAFDGLRLDAVHAIDDSSDPDILTDIAAAVRERIPAGRHVHLVLENDANEARYLARDARGEPLHYVAQWNDDVHHALHVLMTGEDQGYYLDYADDPVGRLVRCLTEGFAYQNDPSTYRRGETRGEVSAHLPPTAFVAFTQNHDQIGNRAMGERMATIAPSAAVRAGLALLLLAPAPPLLFMGEEWASRRPFQFFCDFGDDLSAAVRDGRRREFAAFPEFADDAALARIPDPTARSTFEASKLDWQERLGTPHSEVLAMTRALLALRAREVVPRLAGTGDHAGRALWMRERSFAVRWRLADGSGLVVTANLGDVAALTPDSQAESGRLLFTTHADLDAEARNSLPPWCVRWHLAVIGAATKREVRS
ncbi:MAG: malto-oligosyltrehalose trehalohydrolase [Rhodospirillales bacterium]|nr:malto-oligosyltrehalose trehalohydrolase [Rhodospirillales bacterium]